MKTKIMVSLLLVLIVAISASAVSATEDIADTISETSSINLEEGLADASINDEDQNDGILMIEETNNELDDKQLTNGATNTTWGISTLQNLKDYTKKEKAANGDTLDLKNKTFNLTEPISVTAAVTIKNGNLKAEGLDYFFYIESPENGGPNNITIKDSTFIITKNQSVLFANGIRVGENYVTSIAGITLENITFQIEEGVDSSTASLVYLNCIDVPIGDAYSNEVNIINNNLNKKKSIIIPNYQTYEGNTHFDATAIMYPIEQKHTYIQIFTKQIDGIPVYVVDTAVGDPQIVYQVILVDEDGKRVANKTISFGVDGKEFTAVTDGEGVATLKLNLSAARTYDIYSNFMGDEEYYGSGMVPDTIKVTKKISTFVIKNVSYKVTATKKLSVTFKSPNYTYTIKNGVITRKTTYKLIKNKKVKFTVNGKTYTATTNSKGVATVKITLNKKGTYTYTAKFAGDSKYQAVTKKAKLTVKPLTTSLTTKKYKFKRYKKTKKISTTLKSGKTVLKKQKITFKVNGKTYTAKTNSKGIATVKIKLSKKGTYKYTVKYAGTNKYKAISKTNKVVIVK